ncbi:MAG: hypothetical protein OXF63_01830 [Anaerolineaceae bacterium]|nr:hypothetical protein [Anaerolineaceae bacterium]
MKLHNADRARVEREKLVDYLLDLEHVDGGPKARFFMEFGFSLSHWRLLHEALLRHAREIEVTGSGSSPHGIYYVLEGAMQMADGREAFLRTVWQICWGDIEPGLVTAYPRGRRRTK